MPVFAETQDSFLERLLHLAAATTNSRRLGTAQRKGELPPVLTGHRR
jgi:hypothetical protein